MAKKKTEAADQSVSEETPTVAKKAKKTAAKKTAAKKSSAKKAAAKPTTAKKAAAKKSAVKKTTTKKTAAKKSTVSKASLKQTTSVSIGAKAKAFNLSEVIETPESIEEKLLPSSKDEGRISPTVRQSRRSATINGSVLYRQKREVQKTAATESHSSQAPVVHYEEPTEELPPSYNKTMIRSLVKDTEWIYVYWDISESDRMKFPIDQPGYSLALRLYEASGSGQEVRIHKALEDIMVSGAKSSWYVYIPISGRTYAIDLGLKSSHGEFQTISRSMTVSVPTLDVATEMLNQVSGNDLEGYRQLLKLSGAGELADNLSSGTFSAELTQRLSMVPSSSSGMFSGSVVSSTFASETMAKRTESFIDGKDRKFWLVVDAEVIVYGATEPDARVKFMGKEIKLNPDGTFGVRMALPDGQIQFPVVATSADGEEVKTIRPIINRATKPK